MAPPAPSAPAPRATGRPVAPASGPRPIAWLGATTIAFALAVAECLAWLYGALVVGPWLCGRKGARVVLRVTLEQVRFTGAQALPIVALTTAALGTLIFTQANAYVPADYIPKVAATLLVREVVPLVIGMVVVGRSGTAMTVHLATMRLEGEVQALLAMGIVLEHAVVLPRLVGAVAAGVLLGVWGMAVGIVGGFLLSSIIDPLPFRLALVLQAVEPADVALGLGKMALFGAGAALLAVREGLRVRQSTVEIPRAATNSAVRGVGLCIVLNVVLSLVAA